MTNWLKIRLGVLLGGALLLSGAGFLHAQGDYPAPPKTPEDAATMFYQMLSTGIVMDGQSSGVPFNWPRAGTYINSISRSQMQQISGREQSGGPEQLFAMLAQEKNEPGFDARISGTQGAQTVVEVTPSTTPKNREVVVVAEDGGFRVDLKATFGRWNNLSGRELEMTWFRYTGILSPTLSNDPVFMGARENARRASCQSNLKQQMLGVLMYSQDYDERLPPASKWVDVLQPYVKSEQVFKCPSMTAITNGQGLGYAFNQNLSQISAEKISSSATTVAIYETSNPARNWFGPGTGRAYRHAGGSNIAFADGHVKWFLKGNENGVTFKP